MKPISFSERDLEVVMSLIKDAERRETRAFGAELRTYCNRLEGEDAIWELGRIIQYKQKTMNLRNTNPNKGLVLARLLGEGWLEPDDFFFLPREQQALIISEAEMWKNSDED